MNSPSTSGLGPTTADRKRKSAETRWKAIAGRWLPLFLFLLLSCLAAGPGQTAYAEDSVFSTIHVHGRIRTGNLTADVEALRRLGLQTLTTKTPFTDGEPEFVGVSFARLWEMIEPTGASIRAVAADDYAIEVSAQELIEKEAFVAFEQEGRPLRLRDKGPFWLIFPWSRRPDLYASGDYSLSVWQLIELEVK